jgi:predicted Zn-dependent peptidase
MEQQTTILDNGLRVASIHMPHAQSVALSIAVNAGTRSELEHEHGIAHFLEHMAFKGTERRSARQIAEEFDVIGGNLNAYTSMEHTVYYARVLPHDLPLAADILSDIIVNSSFVQEEMERERQVILQEIAMHHDTPEDMVLDQFTALAYPGQTVGRSILGTEASITSASRDMLKDYTARYYGMKNLAFIATGAVKHDELVAMAERYFGNAPQGQGNNITPAVYGGGAKIIPADFEQCHILVGFGAVPVYHRLYRAAQVMATALGGGMSSRLFQEIREKRGLCYTVNAFVSSYADTGLLGVYAACGEDHADELLDVVANEVQGFATSMTDAELARAKNQLRASILMGLESTGGLAETLGRHMLYYGEYKQPQEVIDSIMNVSREDIAALLGQSLQTRPTIAALGLTAKCPDEDRMLKRFSA